MNGSTEEMATASTNPSPGHHLQLSPPAEDARSANQALAEHIWASLYRAACSTDNRVAMWNSAIYRNLERALIAAIRVGWGISVNRARRVLSGLSDNNESVAYNVRLMKDGVL